MMRKYETIFVAHPSLDEEAVKALIEKFKGVIENGNGTVDNVDFRSLHLHASQGFSLCCL